MKRIILAALIGATSLISSVQSANANPYYVTCTRDYGSSVNLRRGPTRAASVVASIPAGNYVNLRSWVWGEGGYRWYNVQSYGLVGWMREDYICP